MQPPLPKAPPPPANPPPPNPPPPNPPAAAARAAGRTGARGSRYDDPISHGNSTENLRITGVADPSLYRDAREIVVGVKRLHEAADAPSWSRLGWVRDRVFHYRR